MDRTCDVLVVGAGMAGLTAAAYAAKAGRDVLICEKAEKVGGLVTDFTVDGFHFDAGLRAIENSGVIHPMLRDLGLDVPFYANPVTIRIQHHQIRLNRDGLSQYGMMLAALFPQQEADIQAILHEIRRVMDVMDVLYGIDNPLFMDMKSNPTYLMRTVLPWLLRYQRNIRKVKKLQTPIETYLSRFTTNQALIDIIAQHFFRYTPCFFALSYFGLYQDYQYPKGGTGALAAMMVQYLHSKQVDIQCQTEIMQINAAAKTAWNSAGESIRYREMIWAADAKALYGAVEQHANLPKSFTAMAHKVASARGGDSVLSVFMALDVSPAAIDEAFGAHCFYTPATQGLSSLGLDSWQHASLETDHRKALETWVDRYLSLTTYEVSCPVLRDATLAPAGQCGLIVSTLFSYDLTRLIQQAGWLEEWKSQCTERILDQLAIALPQMRDRVIFTDCATPLTLQSRTSNTDGAITGWAFSSIMPAESRFEKIAQSVQTPIPHVHQAGQWTFSPSGLPVSIITGKLSADRVLKELSRNRHDR